ncbi:MAG: undecaprenyl-diphosphate phosphatase [Candidatus Doudnabacteria bacterium]
MLHAIILGLVQGLGEFLPISSSGHLIITSWFLGWPDQGLAFDVALHWGTLFAVAIYFRKDYWEIARHGFRSLHPETRDLSRQHHQRLAWYIIVATIPAAMAGFFLADVIEQVLRDPLIVATTLAVVGIVLWLADYYGKKSEQLHKLTLPKALLVGLVQALSIVPGVSRSGSTMIAGLFVGLTREDSARFSFLISAPIILGAGLAKLPDVVHQAQPLNMFVGFLAALISGWMAIKFLLKYVSTKSFSVFAIYRLILAAVIILVYIIRL